jgi:alanyl-tRNA synthetase
MNTTERLYYNDSHLTEFAARVVGVSPLAGGRVGVRLDRTAFYPTGGGQPSDTGWLNEARVVECVDEEEEGVLHILEGTTDAPQSGASLRGRVDWPRRLDHLQQHTGQHILSQAFVKLFDAETRGFRMSERVSEIDVALVEPSDARIEEAVALANQIIWENRPLLIRQVTPQEAAALPLRKDSAREGELRIIEIEDFDLSPCGGTHAKRTGEVGSVAVRSWERAKGLTRLEFVAGNRAHADYLLANETARGVAALFSVGRDEAVNSVERLLEENKQLARRTRALEELAARVEAEELLSKAARDAGERRHVVTHIFEGRDADALRRLAHAVIAHPQAVALLASLDGDSARLVFARAADVHADMNALMREACAPHKWRGGGRPDMAQGGGACTDAAQLAAVMQAAQDGLAGR